MLKQNHHLESCSSTEYLRIPQLSADPSKGCRDNREHYQTQWGISYRRHHQFHMATFQGATSGPSEKHYCCFFLFKKPEIHFLAR